MNLKCMKCGTRMVQHEEQYTCLKCEARVVVEEWEQLADIKSASELGDNIRDDQI